MPESLAEDETIGIHNYMEYEGRKVLSDVIRFGCGHHRAQWCNSDNVVAIALTVWTSYI